MNVKNMTTAILPDAGTELTNGLKSGRPAADKKGEATRKVAREFEAMFVGMMLKSMRETTGTDRLTGGGHGEETYRSLMDQEYARIIAENGGLGLASVMEKQLAGTGASESSATSGKSREELR